MSDEMEYNDDEPSSDFRRYMRCLIENGFAVELQFVPTPEPLIPVCPCTAFASLAQLTNKLMAKAAAQKANELDTDLECFADTELE